MSYHRPYYDNRVIDQARVTASIETTQYLIEKLLPVAKTRTAQAVLMAELIKFKIQAEKFNYATETLFRLNETSERATTYSVEVMVGRREISKPKSVHIGAACSVALCIGIAIFTINILGAL